MLYRLEVFVLPVSDVDVSKAFYEMLGWSCDVDHVAGPEFRVVQFTPPGSGCSLTFGVGMPVPGEPGSFSGMHLVVDDVEEACSDLTHRGIDFTGPYHFSDTGQADGLHPDRIDFGTYASFTDPDGNVWLIQEVPSRAGREWTLG